ncbi:MAG: hypothetical protein DCF15_17010 [Phormidesmis priestleyi]|uniref:Low temperature-induced protein n=1 Tax=Phormidesmis priestleyi TaxID=268141 RepID=A0A2W4X1I4_9CYAN|nr:MAG: hypothetical protein DCF15_17010 [Phormidesmis priestleyi]
MKTIFSTGLRALKGILLVGLVSFSLWILGLSPAVAADTTDYLNDPGTSQSIERYEAIQPKTDGMNNFEDTDPRRNTQQAEAKGQALKDTAKRRQIQASDPFEPMREALGDAKAELSETADDLQDDVGDKASDFFKRD